MKENLLNGDSMIALILLLIVEVLILIEVMGY